MYFGRGFFLPFGFLPFPVPLDVVVGEPIHVEKFEGKGGVVRSMGTVNEGPDRTCRWMEMLGRQCSR